MSISIWWEAIAFLMLAVCLLVGMKAVKGRRLPPGPFGWPVIGNLPVMLKGLPHHNLAELSRVYGPIVGLMLGQQPAVVVSSPALAEEVLSTHDNVLAERASFSYAHIMLPNDIVFSRRSSQWRVRRKLCVVHLLTAKRLQDQQHVRQQVMADLLQTLHRHAAEAVEVDVDRLMGKTSAATMLRLICSHSEVLGENLHPLIEKIDQQFIPTAGDLIPWLSFLNGIQQRGMRKMRDQLNSIVAAILQQREQEMSTAQASFDDLLQALLSKEIDDRTMENASEAGQERLTLTEIYSILKDLLGAGVTTTATSIQWAMSELMKNPRCFRRLQQELDEVVGGREQEQVTDAHIASLPYLKCVVKEVLRLHPPLALLVPHISAAECKLGGYAIPENTIVFVNVWAIGRDERVWSQAAEFIPERFEGTDIDVKGHHYGLLPFGAGRRACLGLPLGLLIIQLTLANLVRSLDWELPRGQTPETLNMDERKGLGNNRVEPLLLVPKPRPVH